LGAQPDSSSFGAALGALHAELDWAALGAEYCHTGGESFFLPEQREALLDAGLHFASDIGAALEQLPAPADGRSLYIGAALFELPVVLCEQLVLGREVSVLNRPCAEVDELNRALAVVAASAQLELPHIATAALDPARLGAFDHVWLVSVLTDPEAFPALHDELYERAGTQLATGRGDAARERTQATELVGQVFDMLTVPGLLTTTDEELTIITDVARARELPLAVPKNGRLSGIVGDVVRTCALS
jgi:hypothetical protein